MEEKVVARGRQRDRAQLPFHRVAHENRDGPDPGPCIIDGKRVAPPSREGDIARQLLCGDHGLRGVRLEGGACQNRGEIILGQPADQKVMPSDPADPTWLGRDRFVLSAGHSSLTQYCQLFLAGYGLELEDIEALRTEGSLTPGHPEFGHTRGVECTTGPLGSGIANAVGFAMAARRERALFDPRTPIGDPSPFDRFVYTIAGDGCMQEGVASEASSLAGAQKLGNLVLIYDDNRIPIEGDTHITFTEDVTARYAAYGWHVQEVDWTNGGTDYTEDLEALRPRSTIGFPRAICPTWRRRSPPTVAARWWRVAVG